MMLQNCSVKHLLKPLHDAISRVMQKQSLWRVGGFAGRADNNSATDKAKQRVIETAILRHVLALHLLVAAFLHSDSPPSALYAPENDSFFHHLVESIE
jgi:hypothetical protein